MIVVHANWTGGALCLWGEREPGAHDRPDGVHPASAATEDIARLLRGLSEGPHWQTGEIELMLPTIGGAPQPSPSLAHAIGIGAHGGGEEDNGAAGGTPALRVWRVPCLRVEGSVAPLALDRLEEAADAPEGDLGAPGRVIIAGSARYFSAAGRLARSLMSQQRIVPMLVSENGAGLRARWQPWLHDEGSSLKFAALCAAMPPVARAAVDGFGHQAPAITEDFLATVVDGWSRRALVKESMIEAIEGRDAAADPQVAWLSGLLGDGDGVPAEETRRSAMVRTVRRWIGGLDDRGAGGSWRLCLRLSEPIFLGDLRDLEAPGSDIVWSLSLHLQSVENETVLIEAEDVWSLRAETASVGGRRIDAPQDLLLKELARASRIYRTLERALSDSSPCAIELTTPEAYEFLREARPPLIEQGVGVIVPDWWESPAARIGARLRLDAPSSDAAPGSVGGPPGAARSRLGLQALVGYQWQIAVGDTPLTLAEFERLAAARSPLLRIDGRWVEVRPEDVRAAVEFIRRNPGGDIAIGEALRMAYRSDPARTGVPILGLDATGWAATLLDATSGGATMPMLETPEGFHGALRPYQQRGLSWLAFLDDLGLGACLADDMGLGKTVQLLALLVHEKNRARETGGETGPTLLVVPMSIVANWKREADRFAPGLRVHIHHGVDRPTGREFFDGAVASDLVVTTYALANRDREMIELVPWHRVVLDEAQNIKNPGAKQSQAVRSLPVSRRIALTGTPLENRLSELWSIVDFCNPALLGALGDFRSYYAVPVERYNDKERSRALRMLVRPFILRRLKTDPAVISDLPEKVETKEYCRLTGEQAAMYEDCVKQMLTRVEAAEGIRRRGLVLTALIRLKQICNHPLLLPRDGPQPVEDGPPNPARSGKCIRLLELLEEVVASGQQALVFTQYRQMALLLAAMLRQGLDREVLVLHGGTTQSQRQQIIDRFQRADGSAPVLVLSLKAGGVGLNLTAASHVFHFDRWWNPAVENQATDRAFRIGQTRTVSVHKFVVGGTLEDRIDQMIESKIALAEDVIGSGEHWLTELSTAQLRDILTLRPEAIGDE